MSDAMLEEGTYLGPRRTPRDARNGSHQAMRAFPRLRWRSRALGGLLSAAALLTVVSESKATIVWEGKEVAAWPDSFTRPIEAPGSAQFAEAATPLFPHPAGVVHGLTILVDFSDQTALVGSERKGEGRSRH